MARKILLADDSVTAQNMGRKILADAGYDVITVNNGSAALKKIAEFKPDLVVLDVYMPGYSGLEVCQRLKDSPESARIPVLLSVGKLEPFKPEEALKVRAEGHIVKPFEASELLSALAKLEDKVVHRPEPSKPGRFARAMAAAEDTSSTKKTGKSGEENGWKSRLGFPHSKPAVAEEVADDSAIYNPINRDLRTVVQTPAEKVLEPSAEDPVRIELEKKLLEEALQDSGGLVAPEAEETVDVAALAVPGIPSDVAPSEVVAFAAATAQLQIAADAAHAKDDNEVQVVPSLPEEESTEPPLITPENISPDAPAAVECVHSEMVAVDLATKAVAEDQSQADASDPVAAQTSMAAAQHSEPQLQDDLPEPATMAIASHYVENEGSQQNPEATSRQIPESGSEHNPGARWIATAVALDGMEAQLSLEQEMQKAYPTFAIEDQRVAAAEIEQEANPELHPAGDNRVEPPAEAVIIATASDSEAQTTEGLEASPNCEIKVVEHQEQQEQVTTIVEAPAFEPESFEDVVAAPESSTNEPAAAASETIELPAAEAVAEPEWIESPPIALEAELRAIEEPANSVADAPRASDASEESEVVKTTAAAWASWREIREAGEPKSAPVEPVRQGLVQKEIEPPPPDASGAAMAVAAGAERAQEISPSANEASADVASIVDSVLADLRPKLMEEIRRKMAERK